MDFSYLDFLRLGRCSSPSVATAGTNCIFHQLNFSVERLKILVHQRTALAVSGGASYYRDAVMSFKCLTGCAPGYLSTQFIRRCDVTNRRTRSLINIPRFRTASGQRTFCYRAVTLWNTLSNDLKLCESVDQFKRRLRSRLFK